MNLHEYQSKQLFAEAITRYEIEHEQGVIEVDVFEGNLSGLVMAEIEFASVEASQDFRPPPWFSREVTDDARYKNKNLAQSGPPS